jgi:putative FmdB family regulatory protein
VPIMEYECPSCSHSFELYQMREDEETEACCPRCGKREVNRKGLSSEGTDEDGFNYIRKNRCRVSFG